MLYLWGYHYHPLQHISQDYPLDPLIPCFLDFRRLMTRCSLKPVISTARKVASSRELMTSTWLQSLIFLHLVMCFRESRLFLVPSFGRFLFVLVSMKQIPRIHFVDHIMQIRIDTIRNNRRAFAFEFIQRADNRRVEKIFLFQRRFE